MGYHCTKYGPCGHCSSFARGDRRKRLNEEMEETTKRYEDNISARFHPGIDNDNLSHCYLQKIALHGNFSHCYLLKIALHGNLSHCHLLKIA